MKFAEYNLQWPPSYVIKEWFDITFPDSVWEWTGKSNGVIRSNGGIWMEDDVYTWFVLRWS